MDIVKGLAGNTEKGLKGEKCIVKKGLNGNT